MDKKKEKIIKRRRRFIFLIVVFIILLLFFYLFFRKKDYSLKYNVSDYQVEETFYKNEKYYLFSFKKEGLSFDTILEDSNFIKKKVVYKIDEYKTDNETCLKIYSNQLKFYPLCQNEKGQISVHLVSDAMKENFTSFFQTLESVDKVYNKINISNYLHHDYYIWNYRGFTHLNEFKEEDIKLFQKDIYEPKLLTQVNDYLFVPNYNEEYFFNSVYLINQKTGKEEVWNLTEPIYFDSVVLGTYEDSIYLVDKHEKVEWKITPKNKTLEKVGTEGKGGVTYQKEWINVSMIKLINQDYTFSSTMPITYQVKDGLYKNISDVSILIRKNSPNKIVASKGDFVFYLVDDTLYAYSPLYGEVMLMSYFEWNFNNNNVIFVF